MKPGKIIPNGVSLEKHELETIVFFTNLGKDIELIPPHKINQQKSADMVMEGIIWEMKSPRGKGKYLMRDTLNHARKQSPNIIVDLRRVKLHQSKCLQELEKYFQHYKDTQRLLIITKESRLLTYRK